MQLSSTTPAPVATQPVFIDARGEDCRTSASTIEKSGSDVLRRAARESGRAHAHFVDCDPAALKSALYYARTGLLPPGLDESEVDLLTMEAEALGMPRLQAEARVQKARLAFARRPCSSLSRYTLEDALVRAGAFAQADALQASGDVRLRPRAFDERGWGSAEISRMCRQYVGQCEQHELAGKAAPAAAYLGLGRCLLSEDAGSEHCPNALTACLKAVALVPENPYAWELLGKAYQALPWRCDERLPREAFERATALKVDLNPASATEAS